MRSSPTLIWPVLAVLFLAGCSSPDAAHEPSPSATAASPSASPSASASGPVEVFAPGAPTNQCFAANLAVTVTGPDGSAGHLNYQVVFTNTGPLCVLEGFPGVTIVGQGNGTQLGARADDEAVTPASVTLASGGTAVAQLSAVNIDPGGGPLGAGCDLGHGDGYRITPPHSYEEFTVAAPGVAACTNGVAWMTIGPVTAG